MKSCEIFLLLKIRTMATNFSPCKGSYVLNQFPSNVMFGMNGFHVSASGAIQGHHGPLVHLFCCLQMLWIWTGLEIICWVKSSCNFIHITCMIPNKRSHSFVSLKSSFVYQWGHNIGKRPSTIQPYAYTWHRFTILNKFFKFFDLVGWPILYLMCIE